MGRIIRKTKISGTLVLDWDKMSERKSNQKHLVCWPAGLLRSSNDVTLLFGLCDFSAGKASINCVR